MEGVEVEQFLQWNIITEVVAEPNTFTFLVIGDITTKFSQCRARLEMAKKESCGTYT